jgi:CRISPR-associated protein Csd2
MAARKLFVFEHDSAMGNAPAHKLFELVQVNRSQDDAEGPARSFSDYVVSVNGAKVPTGVTLHDMI